MLNRIRNADRTDALIAAGALFLAAAAVTRWHAAPSSLLSYIRPGYELVVREAGSGYVGVMKCAALLYGLLAAGVLLAGYRTPRLNPDAARRGGWLLLVALLAFPCWVQLYEPERLSDSHVLHVSMEDVVGDMELSANHQQRDWRRWQRLNVMGAVSPPRLSPHDTRLMPPSMNFLFLRGVLFRDILGVNNVFLAFADVGWLLGMIGAALVLTGIYMRLSAPLARLRADAGFGAAVLTAAMALLLIPWTLSEYHALRGDAAYSMGDLPEADRRWRASLRRWPARDRSWRLLSSLGAMPAALACEACPEAHLHGAYASSLAGDYSRALESLERAEALSGGAEGGLRFWLGAVHAVRGAELFNAGQVSAAQEHWRKSLAYVPTLPFPWYGLALAHLRHQEFARAAACLDQLVKLQRHFTFGQKLTVRSQAFTAKSWTAFKGGDWSAAHDLRGLALAPDKWE